MSKTWLITGSAHGLGRAIVEMVLRNGDRVFATARNTERLADLKQAHGNSIVLCTLDVTDAAAAQATVDHVIKEFGRLDVLVNNAGFAQIAPFEQASAADFKAQIDTNFYGVVNLTRAALPYMRKQGAGHIINISSGAGRLGAPGLSAYHAAKFAVGGFTESVAKEVGSFGVKMVAVEPGSMPTSWARTASEGVPELLPEYQATVGHMSERTRHLVGNEVGDLDKYAKVIFELSRKDSLPAHLILGSDALFFIRMVETAREKSAAEWEHISRSTDRDGVDLSFMEKISLG
jgi:NAD(P)-dependent dehydrogenase (short-subunit alcohol dehydrogenase family)